MKRALLSLVASFVVLAGCVPKTGTVARSVDDASPIVSVSAGTAPVGKGQLYANYLIDRVAEECFFATWNALATIDCCKLASGLPDTRALMTWNPMCSSAAAPTQTALR